VQTLPQRDQGLQRDRAAPGRCRRRSSSRLPQPL